MYVIQRTDGAFVARPGSTHSYTRVLQCAQGFTTREMAEKDRCPENEQVINVDALLRLNR